MFSVSSNYVTGLYKIKIKYFVGFNSENLNVV